MSEWLELLRDSPSFATRLLPPAATTHVVSGGASDYRTFLGALDAGDRALAVDGLDLLSAGYLPFLRDRLPRLIEALRFLRSDRLDVVGPALSGQPVWGRTVLGWSSGTLEPDRFVSRVPIRVLDLPENIALRLLLRHLAVLSAKIIQRIGKRTHPTVQEIGARAQAAMRNPAIRAISESAGASEQMLRATEGSRDLDYREAGLLLRRRLALSGVDDLARWRRSAYSAALDSADLAPTAEEDVFELLGLARVLDVLEHEIGLGSPVSFWMRIGSNARSGPVARFEHALSGVVEIYFDRTPSFFLEAATPYSEIFRAHEGLGRAADRRPDIVLVRYGPDGTKNFFFVEAKLPALGEFGSYLRDSIYKGFGYLYDFAALWAAEQRPKVALFVPTDVGLKRCLAEFPELTVVSARRPKDLARAIQTALEL